MSAEPTDSEYLATLTVLYAEDDPVVRSLTSQFLKRRVGRLIVAEDGAQALEFFESEKPSLLVSDVLMPRLDGLALSAEVRRRDPFLPIVLITAFEKTEFMRQAIEVGVDRYVLKPIDSDLLEAALRHCARRVRAEVELARARRQELELLQARHASWIGVLAAGLAHDYNNLLQRITTAIDFASDHEGQSRARMLQIVQDGVAEAARLGTRLKMLSREGSEGYTRGPVDDLARDAVSEALMGRSCATRFSWPAEPVTVVHHPANLSSVFATLAQNAAEAMGDGGLLTVVGTVVTLGELNEAHVPLGRYLQITFEDRGRGIPPELLAEIFEPYATTKARGVEKGVGLSLAIARAVMLTHRGTIKAESRPGQTAFHLYLPISVA